VGRFISVDPVGVDLSSGSNFSRYRYAANNPYTFTDPDGRQEAADRFGDQFKKDAESGNSQVYEPFEKPAMVVAVVMAAPVVAVAGIELTAAALANPAAATVLAGELTAGGVAVSSGALVPNPVSAVESMTAGQLANLARFEKSLPAGNTGVAVDSLGSGVAMTASVPGKVPGSQAIYQKVMDSMGKTMSYLKTTKDPAGQVVHIKDKINNVELPKY